LICLRFLFEYALINNNTASTSLTRELREEFKTDTVNIG